MDLIAFHLFVYSLQQRLHLMFTVVASAFKTSAQLRLENLALRQQLVVLRRSTPKRLKLTTADRIFWLWMRRVWVDWKSFLVIVKPETVVAWHRKGFRLFWRWKSRNGKPGRPRVSEEVRDLIRMMSRNNPRWGAPRIHGELLKLGIEMDNSTASRGISVGPCASLFVTRPRPDLWPRVHCASECDGNQTSPIGAALSLAARLCGTADWIHPPRVSESCDRHQRTLTRADAQVIQFLLPSWRTHLSLGKDAPQGRRTQTPDEGKVIEIQEVGGLHHHYERRVA